jgi:hypothetical protein
MILKNIFFSIFNGIVRPEYIALKWWQIPNITVELFVNDLHPNLKILYENEGVC